MPLAQLAGVRLLVRLVLATVLALPIFAIGSHGPAIAAASSPTGPPNYTAIDLGAIGGNYTEPNAINNQGDIVGAVYDYNAGTATGVEWHSDVKTGTVTGPITLPNFGSDHGSVPVDINDNGQAVGGEYGPPAGGGSGLLWDSQGVHAVGPAQSSAIAINDNGDIIGTQAGGADWLLKGGDLTEFPPVLTGTAGYANQSFFAASAINDSEDVVGKSFTPYGWAAYLGTGSSGEYLQFALYNGDNLTGCPCVTDINTSGEVAGAIPVSCGPYGASCKDEATSWLNGIRTDLGPGYARAINNPGQLVGDMPIASGVEYEYGAAMLWQDGQAYDLNTLIPADSPFTLSEATDINDAGQIIAIGYPLPLDPNFNDVEHAFLLNPVVAADTDLPTVTVPSSPIIAEATGPHGAAVSFSVGADDPDEGALTADCNPASGSTFPLGSTTVTCTATDAHGNTGRATFMVLVRDTTPPDLTLPTDITVDATSPHGAQVLYPAGAVDLVDGTDPVNCFPPSGTIFPIGSTIVNCSATDHAGNTASGSFNVHVKSATDQLNDLATLVSQNKLGPGTSLIDQLQAAATAVAAGANASACGDVQAFINHVNAQSGKSISGGQAAALIAAAKQIMSVLGC